MFRIVIVDVFKYVTVDFLLGSDEGLYPPLKCERKKGVFPRHILVQFLYPLRLRGEEVVVLENFGYLNKDIVIQTATLDTVREWFLRKTPEADAQGRNRLERGKRFYSYCQKYAAQHNWPFRWRMQTVVNVNHDAILMGKAASDILTQPTDEFFMTPTLKNIRENGKT